MTIARPRLRPRASDRLLTDAVRATGFPIANDTTAETRLNNCVYMLPKRQFVSAHLCSYRKQVEMQGQLTAISAVCVIDAAS